MKVIKKYQGVSRRDSYLGVIVSGALCLWFAPWAICGETDTDVLDLQAFKAALDVGDHSRAHAIGHALFETLEEKYKNDGGFAAYESKLAAARSLTEEVASQLVRATKAQMLMLMEDLAGRARKSNRSNSVSVWPAKDLYDKYSDVFSKPIKIDNMSHGEKSFLIQYYDLNLKTAVKQIADAGKSLAVTDPEYKGTYDYTLLLPLLHTDSKHPINTNYFPKWMRQPEQLGLLSKSCLLHFGEPGHAMALAREAAVISGSKFSEIEWYKSAAKQCGAAQVKTGVECLHKAIECTSDEDTDGVISLEFDIVKKWLDSGNYALAAGQAKRISERYPRRREFGTAIWLYYYGLLRSSHIEAVLAGIDEAIADERCKPHRPKLMFLKWLSLRRKRGHEAQLAAVEHEIIKRYGNDPMVAPILLTRATDHLVNRENHHARAMLSEVIEKFPKTKAAEKAKKMLESLKAQKAK